MTCGYHCASRAPEELGGKRTAIPEYAREEISASDFEKTTMRKDGAASKMPVIQDGDAYP
jgi:hypothetical protein